MWTNTTSTQLLYNNDTYLDPIVKSVTWSGDITQAFRTLSVSLSNTFDGVWQAITIEHGKELRFFNEGIELFRGVIFAHTIDAHGQMTVTAYDENVYLTKNSDTKKFTNMTASAIIRALCTEFGIPIGSIAETDYVIPKLILRNKSLWDIMVTALTETKKQSGRRFFIYSTGGNLNVIERGEKRIEWVLENGVNITGATYSQSIEDMRNQVKINGGDETKKPLSALTRDDALIAGFGLMQHEETADSWKTQSQVDELARKLLADLGKIKDTATVDALGLDEVIAGSAVYVSESMTQIVGGFYVITDSHTYEKGMHTMTLTVSGDESLPRLDYDPPEKDIATPGSKKAKKQKAKKAKKEKTIKVGGVSIDEIISNATGNGN